MLREENLVFGGEENCIGFILFQLSTFSSLFIGSGLSLIGSRGILLFELNISTINGLMCI